MTLRRRRFLVAGGAVASAALSGCLGGAATRSSAGGGEPSEPTLTLATTTTTYDTGLVPALLPPFERRFDATVKPVVRGTGAALRLGRAGDADLLFVHDRPAERRFVESGGGTRRYPVMRNEFVVVGPAEDPAGVAEAAGVGEALDGIADAEATFLSRGDDSGTHRRERELWSLTTGGGAPPAEPWYREVGQGMGDALVQADRSGAYTLADRGTFLAMRDRLSLRILLEPPVAEEGALSNPYGLIPVNPAVHPHVAYDLAMALVGFLTGPDGQRRIGEFRVDGERLFVPTALDGGGA